MGKSLRENNLDLTLWGLPFKGGAGGGGGGGEPIFFVAIFKTFF